MLKLVRTSLAAACALLAVALLLPSTAGATVDLTAIRIRIGDHPGFVRAVVDFTDGRIARNALEADDPDPFGDGRALVSLTQAGVQTEAAPASRYGIQVRVLPGTNRIRIALAAAPRRFKYVQYAQLPDPQRAVIDLWKSQPPVRGAERLRDPSGCLSLWTISARPGLFRATGAARNIFENQFGLVLRGPRGGVVASRGVTARNGRWSASLGYRFRGRAPGTLEAVDLSARDGSLACLAQARVLLRP